MSMVYYAHPIDQAPDSLTAKLANRTVRDTLADVFAWVYDPADAFRTKLAPFDDRVQLVNHQALDQVDALFAVLPSGTPTVGVVTEILYASSRGIPTLVFCDRRPVGLGSPPFVRFHISDVPPAQRRGDIEVAARALLEWIEDQEAMEMAYNAQEAEGRQRNAVPGLYDGSAGFLTYHGPLMAERKYHGDAAWDVPAAETVTIHQGSRCRVPTGVYVAPPSDIWLHMVGRSSMFAKGLFVEPGVIDSGWRGELEAKVYNLSGVDITIEAGERIAQLIPHRIEAQVIPTYAVPDLMLLPEGDRGTNGWGSTGA